MSNEETLDFDLVIVGTGSGNSIPGPEFDHWKWVSYWYPLRQVVSFKRQVYRRALKELAVSLVVEE